MKFGPFEIKRSAPAAERRGTLEDPSVAITGKMLQRLAEKFSTSAGVDVTEAHAFQVPAYAAAQWLWTNTVAKLPIHLMKREKSKEDPLRIEAVRLQGAPLERLVGEQINDATSSFDWRRDGMAQAISQGRWLSVIEQRNGVPSDLFPLDAREVQVKFRNGRKVYEHNPAGARSNTYEAAEIIDIPWGVGGDGLSVWGPYGVLRNTIGRALAVEGYSAGFFKGGGVPPLGLEANFETGAAITRASEDITKAIQQVVADGKQVLPMPLNHKFTKLGFEPEKGQMIEVERWLIGQVARGFNLPPVFVGDLSHGNFANTAQQDLNFVKHSLINFTTQVACELNLKLFKRNERKRFFRFDLTAILEGDFVAMMGGWSAAVTGALATPAEAREKIGMFKFKQGSDELFIQGANEPVKTQAAKTVAPATTE